METALDTGKNEQDIPYIYKNKCKDPSRFYFSCNSKIKIEGFTNKRDELSQKFIFRFIVIEFPSFEINKLRTIQKILQKKIIINKLILFKK